ncbi:MAG: shikimate dehydrogenase [Chromatiales bacterium]|nr:shikimate dehydrogenase [Chromatiales bacterium]
MSTADQYAVVGNPIEHSKSPEIHRMFAEQTGQKLEYRPLLAPLDGFRSSVEAFREAGGRGLNITVPFKLEAWEFASQRTNRAERAGAVNTLVFYPDGRILGDNTDGVGLIADLTRNHGLVLAGRRILVLGAGGAARGILGPLLDEGPEEIVIANRTAERAEMLAESFSNLGPVSGCGFDALSTREFDLIINATSASLEDSLPPLPGHVLSSDGCCYDLMYADKPTAFVLWGREHGALKSLDGLGMLVEQAAESFKLWRGLRPDTTSVIQALRTS